MLIQSCFTEKCCSEMGVLPYFTFSYETISIRHCPRHPRHPRYPRHSLITIINAITTNAPLSPSTSIASVRVSELLLLCLIHTCQRAAMSDKASYKSSFNFRYQSIPFHHNTNTSTLTNRIPMLIPIPVADKS